MKKQINLFWIALVLSAIIFTSCPPPEPESQTFTVSFDANGGTGAMDTQTFTSDISQPLTSNTFTRYGYLFDGWGVKDGESINKKYGDNEVISLTQNLALFAMWRVDTSLKFLFHVEDKFSFTGQTHIVVTGKVFRGELNIGDRVEIIGFGKTLSTVVMALEISRKQVDKVSIGDQCGIYVDGIEKSDIERGMVVCIPGSAQEHKKFSADMYMLTKDEGGKHTPIFHYYKPSIYFHGFDLGIGYVYPENENENGMMLPGSNGEVTIFLQHGSAMVEEGHKILAKEGGKTILEGVVKKFLPLDKFPTNAAFLVTSTDNSFSPTIVKDGEIFVPSSFEAFTTMRVSLCDTTKTILSGFKFAKWSSNHNATYLASSNVTTTYAAAVPINGYNSAAEDEFLDESYSCTITCTDEVGNNLSFTINAK